MLAKSMVREGASLFSSRVNLLVVMTGIAFLFFCTPWGIGISPDSTSYIAAARSLLKGEGLMAMPEWNRNVPFTQYGPLFSILLAGVSLFGTDPLTGAKFLNTFLFGANIFLTGWIVFQTTFSSALSFLGSFLILASFNMLWLHAMAFSEPAFLFFTFLGLYVLAIYLEKEEQNYFLILSGFFISLAFLAKYSGVSVAAAGVLVVLLFSRKPLIEKFRNAFLLGTVACFPMVLWLLRNKMVVGSPTGIGIHFDFHPYILANLRQLLAYPSIWLLPKSVPVSIRSVTLLLSMIFFLAGSLMIFKNTESRLSKLPGILWLLIASHIGVYLITGMFLGAEPIDDRALSPVYIAFVILGMLILERVLQMAKQSPRVRVGVISLIVLFALSYLGRAAQWGIHTRKEGLGYSSRDWQNSEAIQKIKTLPAGIPIYSNGVDAIYILTGRPASSIPSKQDYYKKNMQDSKRRLMENYLPEIEKMKEDLRNKNGVLVYLDKIYWRWYYPSQTELQEILGLIPVESLSDGTIYKVRS